MSATSFQRMRRIQALQEALEEKGIDYSKFAGDEAALREALETGADAPDAPDAPEEPKHDVTEAALRAKAKEIGISHWHLKSIETLQEEIAELDKG